MAITVKPISQVERGGFRVVNYEAYQDGALAYTGALRVPLTWDADAVARKLLSTATQRLTAQGGETQDISALIDQELGAADVNPINSLSDEDLRTQRRRELQTALNTYLAVKPDGTDRYTGLMMLKMARVKDGLDAAVAADATLDAGQQALLDRLNLCETQFIAPVTAYFGTLSDAIDAGTREELLAMTSFDFSSFEAADPDIKLKELEV
ncbi:MAG: hypothetical protein KQI62_02275 [Deltaproteobacteria bacterium]|nr:hypothetical protein [Deltaproteobacteria bacterium]